MVVTDFSKKGSFKKDSVKETNEEEEEEEDYENVYLDEPCSDSDSDYKSEEEKEKKTIAPPCTNSMDHIKKVKYFNQTYPNNGFCQMEIKFGNLKGNKCKKRIREGTYHCNYHLPTDIEYREHFDDFIQWFTLDCQIDYNILNRNIKKSLYRHYIKTCQNMAFIILEPLEIQRMKRSKSDRERLTFPPTWDFIGKYTVNRYYFDHDPCDILKKWNVYHKYKNLTKQNHKGTIC